MPQRLVTGLAAMSMLMLVLLRVPLLATGTLMARLPAGSVKGVASELEVHEDLSTPGAPIRFVSTPNAVGSTAKRRCAACAPSRDHRVRHPRPTPRHVPPHRRPTPHHCRPTRLWPRARRRAPRPAPKQAAPFSFALTKSGEPVLPTNSSRLWGGRNLSDVLAAAGDLLGNDLLEAGAPEPTYASVRDRVPPVLAKELDCADFQFAKQSFVGSRVAADKATFGVMGQEEMSFTRQDYHFDTARLTLNNTRAGLLGGHLPALRFHFPLTRPGSRTGAAEPDGYAEQLAFAVPESTDAAPFDVSAAQPVWMRYINVSAGGAIRYVHYVDTFEAYPSYCANATVPSGAGWAPSQLECDGAHAAAFYGGLLSFALYWNSTWERELGMEVAVPAHGIDVGAFAKHSIIREMITRRDHFHPRYGVPPNAYGTNCCDGFQDVFIAALAT